MPQAMFRKRSRLGLVGSSLDILKDEWSSREATIGPGIDSYYEYLLKAYLIFGDEQYLDMFLDLYSSTMRWLQSALFKGYAFLVDVNMDSGGCGAFGGKGRARAARKSGDDGQGRRLLIAQFQGWGFWWMSTWIQVCSQPLAWGCLPGQCPNRAQGEA